MEKVSATFHLGDVLSVLHGLVVSPRQMEGVVQMLRFMTGTPIAFKYEMEPALAVCQPVLQEQFPSLSQPEVATVVETLRSKLKNERENMERKRLILEWLDEQVAIHGEFVRVQSL